MRSAASWEAITDDETGHHYFHHPNTGASQWEEPPSVQRKGASNNRHYDRAGQAEVGEFFPAATATATAAAATIGPAPSAAVAPGRNLRVIVHRFLEQGRPAVITAGSCNALFDAVVSKRLVVSSTPSD